MIKCHFLPLETTYDSEGKSIQKYPGLNLRTKIKLSLKAFDKKIILFIVSLQFFKNNSEI